VLTEDDFGFLAQAVAARSGWVIPPNMTLQELEKQAIALTLDRTQRNVKEAAAVLGIDRSTLYEKLKRYEIPR
jgi:transcriptional regulator of acetoin/glycerol metabolism